MPQEIEIELIHIVPTLIVIAVVCGMLLAYRRPIAQLVSRVGSIKAFGVEAQFSEAEKRLIKASQTYNLAPNEQEVESLIKRAERIRDLLDCARILWVDDRPLTNATIYRFLNIYNVHIDNATSTDEALDALQWSAGAYDVVVTDMVRGNDKTAGLSLIHGMQKLGVDKAVIIIVSNLETDKPTPAGAQLITNSPLKLIHGIMNAIESHQ